EVAQVGTAERGGERYVRGIAARSHQHSADAGYIVAGIEGPPAVLEVNLKPRAEVHGAAGRHSNVSQITGGIPGRDVQGAAKGDGEMLKVAADTHALGKHIEGRLGGPSLAVIEHHLVMDPVADGLHSPPSRLSPPE